MWQIIYDSCEMRLDAKGENIVYWEHIWGEWTATLVTFKIHLLNVRDLISWHIANSGACTLWNICDDVWEHLVQWTDQFGDKMECNAWGWFEYQM